MIIDWLSASLFVSHLDGAVSLVCGIRRGSVSTVWLFLVEPVALACHARTVYGVPDTSTGPGQEKQHEPDFQQTGT
jgi:hypothetical protein